MNNDQFYKHWIDSVLNKKAVALSYKDQVLSYEALVNASINLSRRLPDVDYLILNMDKSADYILSLLACIYRGVPFVPVPKNTPEERLNYIESDLKKEGKRVYCLSVLDNLDNEDVTHLRKNNEVAYVIYTSGSTGHPKGVEVGYRGLLNIVNEQIKFFKMEPNDNFLWLLSLGFDASLSDIFVTLFSGATLRIPEQDLNTMLLHSSLYSECNAYEITVSDIPPSVLKKLSPESFKHLKKIVVGGEVASSKTFQRFYESGIDIFNVYGPTEATICTSMSKYSSDFIEGEIGVPVKNIDYALSDEGELLISGVGLAKGYTDKELTRNRFITVNGVLHYRTGDLARFENNRYVFEGRLDRQFKKNGQLICPEEIEKALLSLDEVLEATVTYDGVIKASVSLTREQEVSVDFIKSSLKNKLPDYMIPNKIMIESELEKNANGKVVFQKNNTLLMTVKSIFEDLLKQPVDDLDASFYNLGGDSLLFMDIILKLEEQFTFDVMDVLHDDSINGITKVLAEEKKNKKHCLDLLPPSPENVSESQVISSPEKKHFLLTGATGFLGAYLLKELTQSNINVTCLVRSDSPESGLKRVIENAQKYGLTLNDNWIEIVTGDVTKPNFGLKEESIRDLKMRITDVIHGAALVNNLSSIEKAIAINVSPSKYLLEFVRTGVRKRIHNVSTLSVFVSSVNVPEVITEDMSCNVMESEDLYTAYAQSKWMNEYYLDSYAGDTMVTHYRLGLLTPSLTFPYFKGQEYLKEVFEDLSDADLVSEKMLDLSFDLTPVDSAAQMMVQYLLSEVKKSRLHITSDCQVSVKDLLPVFNVDIDKTNSSNTLSKFSYELTGRNSAMNIFETTRVLTFSPSCQMNIDKIKYLKAYKRGMKYV